VRESDYGRRPGVHVEREERRSLVVSLNDRVAASAVRHHFEDSGARVPFQCECGAADCQEFALHSVAEYTAIREDHRLLLAPGHAD